MGQRWGDVVEAGGGPPLKHVGEIQNDDDRDRDADGPGENAFHGGAPLVVLDI